MRTHHVIAAFDFDDTITTSDSRIRQCSGSRERVACTARNPGTGALTEIAAAISAKFGAGKACKDAVDGTQKK
jgi:hypothetical protein